MTDSRECECDNEVNRRISVDRTNENLGDSVISHNNELKLEVLLHL